MPLLFQNGQRDLSATVINAGYNFVLCLLMIAGKSYVFSVETFPQADSQKTLPVQDTPIEHEGALPLTPKPVLAYEDNSTDTTIPTKAEALAYWTSNVERNADGTRKGGIFGAANLGVAGDIFIGDEIMFNVIENTAKNTHIQIDVINTCACNIKAYACQTASPQAVVDTPNFVLVDALMYVFVIARGLLSKSQGKVDYPSTDTTQSIAIAGGGFVGGNQTVQDAHDAETTEEGAKAKDAVVMQTFNLPQRTDPAEEPRYCLFSFTTPEGITKRFGVARGSTNNIQVRYFGELGSLPTMYKATDKKEVMAGFWMPVEEFLDLSNDPTTTDAKYVPWVAHQAIVRDAVAAIQEL
jgi:hypothetical protein